MSKSLSKSKYISGQQCTKLLWFQSIGQKPPEEVDEGTKDRLKAGEDVGNYAKELFPGGVEIEFQDSRNEMIKDTNLAIKAGKPIYEATFMLNNTLIRADLMNETENGWDMYEVKSSSKIKPYHIEDASFQWHLLSKTDEITLNEAFVVTVNSDYLRDGPIDVNKLFTQTNITNKVNERLNHLPEQIKKMESVINGSKEPNIPIGDHCSKPHPCQYKKLCWKDVNDNSVLNLYRMRSKQKFDLFDNGYKTFDDLPKDISLSETQQKQVNSYLSNESYIDTNKVSEFVNTIEYPISYFDFETFQDAVPRFDNQRPYMQMPFQFSLHTQNKPLGKLKHFQYIADHKIDPRTEIAEKLLEWIPPKGTIIAYNQSFEMNCIKELARFNPQLSDQLLALNDRFIDLIIPFRKGYYYHPEFKGSFSIKKVLPALCPNDPSLNYNSLNIKGGGEASVTYKKFNDLTEVEIKSYRKDLSEYCELDTLAMVRILEQLIKLLSS